jgi:phosphate-selective porin OprO/OprP
MHIKQSYCLSIMKTSTRFVFSTIAVVGFLALPLLADEQADIIQGLEKRVEQLEKLLSEREAKPAAPADAPRPAEAFKPGPSLSIGASGFMMRSADSNFALRIRGLLQVDSRWYVDDGGIPDNDGFVLRRARPIIEGTVFRDFDFRFTPEFAGSSPTIRDAWLNYTYDPALQFRVGKMKPPGGLERWQSIANVPFIERAMVSGLWPSREVGVMFQGDLWPGDEAYAKRLDSAGLLQYEVGAFNGTGDDRAAANSDFDGNTEMAGRLFVHPFLKTDWQPLRGLGLGVAGTYGDTEGANGLPAGSAYGTEGQQDFFNYLSGDGTTPATANVIAHGNHWRVGPQAYWYYGPFGLQGEYGISSQEVQRQDGTLTDMRLTHRGWAVNASWLLTGEDASFRAITPAKNFDPHANAWGALQFVARYSVLDIDNETFPNFADPAESATRANAWGVGLNWYLNRNVRAALNFNHTDFKGGANGPVTRQDENVFLTRMQLAF